MILQYKSLLRNPQMRGHLLVLKMALMCLLTFATSRMTQAQTLTPPDITLQTFYTGLNVPVGIYNCGDHRLFVVEQNQGDIEIIDTTGAYLGKFLDVSPLISFGGERGLLGLAFHPNYAQNGYFYINYTNTQGHTVVSRYQVSGNANEASESSATTLITINQPYSNHNGGHIAFGPDGYLYIGMGDGGSGGDPENRSQTPTTLQGKMLRIDVDNGSPYSIPATNPFFGQSDTLPEIWALGLRNPWKFSFDIQSGDMWIGDVGQNQWEEINFEPAGSAGGSNWGWRCYEGNATYNSTSCQPSSFYDFPVKVHNHNEGFCSITGGVVYRGNEYPALDGLYFYSDYCDGDVYSLTPDGNGNFTSANLFAAGGGIVAFGHDADGEVYVVKNSGPISKMEDTCPFYPTISSNGDGSISSAAGTQFWWYKNDVIISGANSQTYIPTSSGTYYAHVSNGSCTRRTNSLSWLVTGGIGGCTYAGAINYNLDADVDDGSCLFDPACVCPADLDANGLIAVNDLIIFLGQFGSACNE